MMAPQPRFFDLSDRHETLSAAGDQLKRLAAVVNLEVVTRLFGQRSGGALVAKATADPLAPDADGRDPHATSALLVL